MVREWFNCNWCYDTVSGVFRSQGQEKIMNILHNHTAIKVIQMHMVTDATNDVLRKDKRYP